MNITLDVSGALKEIGKVASDYSDKSISVALHSTAQAGIQVIQDRTEKGKGYKGNLKPYTPSYAAWKTKPKRRSKSGYLLGGGAVSTKVNLSLTGDMMRGMQAKKGNRFAEIFFAGSPERGKKAVWNNRTRPFFGFSAKERKALMKHFVSVL